MNIDASHRLGKGYRLGLLSGLTWGIDTTLLAVALALSPFSDSHDTLLAGIYVCCLIHIFFETIYMSILVATTGGFAELRPAFKSRGGVATIIGGIVGGPVAMLCYLMAIELTGAALTTTVSATYPLIGSLLAMRLLREKTTIQMWIGILLAVFGILYSGTGIPTIDRDATVVGCLIALGAAIGWGLEGVACRYATHHCGLKPKVALLIREYTSLLAYLIISPFFLGGLGEMTDSIINLITYSGAFAIVAVASCFGALSMYLWYRSISKVGAVRGLCMNISYCVWTALFSIVVFHNVPASSYTIGGALMTVAGITLALWRQNLVGVPRSDASTIE